MHPKKQYLAIVVEALERHRQRGTYGAVGGVVGLPPQSVMQGQDKNPRNSFVVSKKYQLPTGYTEEQCHTGLQCKKMVISSAEELRTWLKTHK